ncbi:MAG: hypothetical protein WCA77_09915 [Thermoplasmata archaeon]
MGVSASLTVSVGCAIFLVFVAVASASPPPGSASLTMNTSGSLTTSVTLVDPNGSALRFAIDGNFTPLIETLPLNASARAALVTEIANLEAAPLTSGLFGNRSGEVTAIEVARFTSLVEGALPYLPTGSLSATDLLNVTLDGNHATSTSLTGLAFVNATGPDTSSSPLTISVSSTLSFALAGGSHVLAIRLPAVSFLGNLSLLVGVPFTFVGPPGMMISSTGGLTSVSVTNDPWGWASPHLSGDYSPGSGTASVSFTAAFPLGDALLIGTSVVVIAVLGFILFRRRRARKATESKDSEGMGPSGSA